MAGERTTVWLEGGTIGGRAVQVETTTRVLRAPPATDAPWVEYTDSGTAQDVPGIGILPVWRAESSHGG